MKLIDKDKVVAELERRIEDNKKDIELALHENLQDYFEGYEDALVLFKQQYLDTYETKEVDLEKEMSEYLEKEMSVYFVEHSDEFFSDKYKLFARHFYELGLRTKGE